MTAAEMTKMNERLMRAHKLSLLISDIKEWMELNRTEKVTRIYYGCLQSPSLSDITEEQNKAIKEIMEWTLLARLEEAQKEFLAL